MSEYSVDPATLAGDPFAAVGSHKRRFTEAECAEAIAEEEHHRGGELTPRERDAFARGFFADDYRRELRALIALGVEEPGEEDEA